MIWWKELFLLGIEKTLVVETLEGEVDEETKKLRQEACESCPKKIHDKHGHAKCSVCKCYLKIKHKSKKNRRVDDPKFVEVTHCPLGKWNDEHIALLYNQ